MSDHGDTDPALLVVPQGTFEVRRLPHRPRSPLRAWDAADELVLAHVADLAPTGGRWLLVNDLFGALAVALAGHRPQCWGDSVTSHQATTANLVRNGLEASAGVVVPSTTTPTGPVDVAIVKVPRTLALLEDQLHGLRPLLHDGSVVVGAGMVKAIHRSTLETFERIIGPSPTSLAQKKARLVLSELDPDLRPGPSPYPSTYRLDSGEELVEHANVFSRGSLDIGTRVLLEHLPRAASGDRVVDLGCGNGVLGLTIARRSETGTVVFVDESYQAVDSARRNAEAWAVEAETEFVVARDLSHLESGSVDLVVNNPPFHTHRSRGDATAVAMFADAHRVLRRDGRLVVVGNRHLGYHQLLRRRFGNADVIGSNPKFVVVEAVRR